MLDEPLVSVVMAVYNGGPYLDEAVRSVLNQSFREFEFVIVDDGSTDCTGAMLEAYARADPRVRVHHQANRGFAEALNTGCRLARGVYLARMDPDDVSVPDRFERQLAYLRRHPTVDVLGGAMIAMTSEGRLLGEMPYPVGRRQIQEYLLHDNAFSHPTVMMRRAAFCAVGGYRRAFLHAEDYDLWLRLAERYGLENLPEPLLYYRLHLDQVSTRDPRQQILSKLAAQAAARIRRAGGEDPLWHVERITPEVVAQLGVSEALIRKAIARAYIWQADLMLQAGEEAAALALLERAEAASAGRRSRGRAEARARLYVHDAAHGMASRRRGRAVRRLGRAAREFPPALFSRAGLVALLKIAFPHAGLRRLKRVLG